MFNILHIFTVSWNTLFSVIFYHTKQQTTNNKQAPKNINKVVKVTESVVGDLKIGMKQLMKSGQIKFHEREEW